MDISFNERRNNMKISCTSEKVLIIEFTKAELEACHLTYEKIDKSVPESKEAICRIIAEAEKISGEGISITEKTRVDILPDGEGGCLIILNSGENKAVFEKMRVYEAPSADCFLDLAKHIKSDGKHQSSLYEKRGEYRLLVYAEKDIHLKCSEFVDLCCLGEVQAQKVKESYNCLIPENALEVLGGFTA